MHSTASCHRMTKPRTRRAAFPVSQSLPVSPHRPLTAFSSQVPGPGSYPAPGYVFTWFLSFLRKHLCTVFTMMLCIRLLSMTVSAVCTGSSAAIHSFSLLCRREGILGTLLQLELNVAVTSSVWLLFSVVWRPRISNQRNGMS